MQNGCICNYGWLEVFFIVKCERMGYNEKRERIYS